jgi:hypothetical protein
MTLKQGTQQHSHCLLAMTLKQGTQQHSHCLLAMTLKQGTQQHSHCLPAMTLKQGTRQHSTHENTHTVSAHIACGWVHTCTNKHNRSRAGKDRVRQLWLMHVPLQ